jgi:hypothetical protein
MGDNNRTLKIAALLLVSLCFSVILIKYRTPSSSSSNTNIRTQGKFAPISPHTASSGDGISMIVTAVYNDVDCS